MAEREYIDAIVIIDNAPDPQPDSLEFIPDTGSLWDEFPEVNLL